MEDSPGVKSPLIPINPFMIANNTVTIGLILPGMVLRENLPRVRHILAEPPFGVLKPARRGRTLLESESRAVTAAVSLAYSSQVRRTSLHTYMLGHPHTLPTTCVPYTYYYTYYTYTLY